MAVRNCAEPEWVAICDEPTCSRPSMLKASTEYEAAHLAKTFLKWEERGRDLICHECCLKLDRQFPYEHVATLEPKPC